MLILVAPRLRKLVPNSRIDRLISMATNEPVLSGLVDHGTEAGMDPAEMNKVIMDPGMDVNGEC
jgi:hypothetical protein